MDDSKHHVLGGGDRRAEGPSSDWPKSANPRDRPHRLSLTATNDGSTKKNPPKVVALDGALSPEDLHYRHCAGVSPGCQRASPWRITNVEYMYEDLSGLLTPSLDRLNLQTPMPLLGLSGVTAAMRDNARRARLKMWKGERPELDPVCLHEALEKEDSVKVFFPEILRSVGDTADLVVSLLCGGPIDLAAPPRIIEPGEWDELIADLQQGSFRESPPWADAAALCSAIEYVGPQRLAAVADTYLHHEARLAEVYCASGLKQPEVETPWHRWDRRTVLFNHLLMLQVCHGRLLPATPGSVEATRLIRDLRSAYPEATSLELADVMLNAIRFDVGNFSRLREGVVEVPGLGFEVQMDQAGRIVAAAPGRVRVTSSADGKAIRLRFPKMGSVDVLRADSITAQSFGRAIATTGLLAERALLTECLRRGLWYRLKAAAG